MNAFDQAADLLVSRGISPTDAKRAVQQCGRALLISGTAGYFVGQLSAPVLVAILSNPASASALIGVGGAAAIGSMAYQLGWGESCSDLRQAVMNWNSGAFNQSSFQ
jgi:uncharacterized membrane protein YebE (DUF533 family)